jgi:hypothetical protein
MRKYSHSFFNWWEPADLETLKEKLEDKYSVKIHEGESDFRDISIHKDDRTELEVKSDNMVAFMSKFRATLNQKGDSLTRMDKELRDFIKENYPRNRPTPFPWEFNPEPELKIEEERE